MLRSVDRCSCGFHFTDLAVMSGAGSYWEKINVPPVNWETGAKFGGGKDRDPALYQIDLPGITYCHAFADVLESDVQPYCTL